MEITNAFKESFIKSLEENNNSSGDNNNEEAKINGYEKMFFVDNKKKK